MGDQWRKFISYFARNTKIYIKIFFVSNFVANTYNNRFLLSGEILFEETHMKLKLKGTFLLFFLVSQHSYWNKMAARFIPFICSWHFAIQLVRSLSNRRRHHASQQCLYHIFRVSLKALRSNPNRNHTDAYATGRLFWRLLQGAYYLLFDRNTRFSEHQILPRCANTKRHTALWV